MDLPVLVEQTVWPEFAEAIASFGDTWTASSGRRYTLRSGGSRLEVSVALGDHDRPPDEDEVDRDLLEFAGVVYDRVGGEWSAENLTNIARLWGWET